MPTLGTGNGGGGWEELQKQTVDHMLDLSGSDGPNSGSHLFEQFDVLEPAGGLDRNELAELVVYERELSIRPAGGGSTNLNGIQVEWENTMSPDAKLAGKEQQSRETNLDGVTGADLVKQVQEDDPDTIDYYSANFTRPFEDETNGLGGGNDGSLTLTQAVNFREMFEEGPVLDRHDRIYSHVFEGISGAGWEVNENLHLYWDVTSDE